MKLHDVESEYNKAVMELKQLAHLLKNGEKRKKTGGKRQEKLRRRRLERTVLRYGSKSKNIFMKEIFSDRIIEYVISAL